MIKGNTEGEIIGSHVNLLLNIPEAFSVMLTKCEKNYIIIVLIN